MGKQKSPTPVKLVIAMLAKDKKLFDKIEEFFVDEFGDIDYRSPALSFNHTDYYKEEMGAQLKRRFISFKKAILPDEITDIKITTHIIEKKFSSQKGNSLNRRINIDPGYISASKFILATTKDYYHRIYIKNGIYAEVTLRWKNGTFQPFEWTYPDYKTKQYLKILNDIRSNYMKEAHHLDAHIGNW